MVPDTPGQSRLHSMKVSFSRYNYQFCQCIQWRTHLPVIQMETYRFRHSANPDNGCVSSSSTLISNQFHRSTIVTTDNFLKTHGSQGSPNRWEPPVKPVRPGSGLGRYQTGPNSKFKIEFKKMKNSQKIS